MLRPESKIDENVELPPEFSGLKSVVEALLEKQKLETSQNMELLNLGGNSPDEKLL